MNDLESHLDKMDRAAGVEADRSEDAKAGETLHYVFAAAQAEAQHLRTRTAASVHSQNRGHKSDAKVARAELDAKMFSFDTLFESTAAKLDEVESEMMTADEKKAAGLSKQLDAEEMRLSNDAMYQSTFHHELQWDKARLRDLYDVDTNPLAAMEKNIKEKVDALGSVQESTDSIVETLAAKREAISSQLEDHMKSDHMVLLKQADRAFKDTSWIASTQESRNRSLDTWSTANRAWQQDVILGFADLTGSLRSEIKSAADGAANLKTELDGFGDKETSKEERRSAEQIASFDAALDRSTLGIGTGGHGEDDAIAAAGASKFSSDAGLATQMWADEQTLATLTARSKGAQGAEGELSRAQSAAADATKNEVGARFAALRDRVVYDPNRASFLEREARALGEHAALAAKHHRLQARLQKLSAVARRQQL